MNLTLSGEMKILSDTLDKLKPARKRAIMRSAMRVAATPIVRAAKRNARRHSKSLSKSIGRRITAYPATNTVVVNVGPRTKYFAPDGTRPSKIAHFFEYGTKPHRQKRGMHPGQKATPWLGPAVEAERTQMLTILQSRMGDGLVKEINRIALGFKGRSR